MPFLFEGAKRLLYNLKRRAKIILSSDLTRTGLQSGGNGVVVHPLGEVTPPAPAK